jgi:carbon-monoxide dehydrogenase large subunit
MTQSGSILGNSVLRKEDPGLLKGANQYFDDITLPGLAHVVFVRSTVAHARIESIDTTDAETMPGVVAVYTHDTLPMGDYIGPIGPTHPRPSLASGKVRFVGDIVAAVVAETRAQAADAAEAVVVDYDILPAVVDLEESLAGGTLLFEEIGSNICFMTAHGADVDALAGADVVVEQRILSQRLAGVPMEPNGCIAEFDGTKLTLTCSHQAPHAVQGDLAAATGLDAGNIRVKTPWVGGGFGPKAAYYVEYGIAAAAAKTLGRAVKWTETRSENLLSMVHGRSFIMDAKLGLTNDGKIVGLECSVLADGGAYPVVGVVLPMLTQLMSEAVYVVPKLKFEGKTVLTNTTSIGAYRGAGRPEATQYVERILDIAADRIGMDPAEIRRVNFIQPDQFPYTTGTGANYDSGDYEKALDKALEVAGYGELRAEQARRRAAGDGKLLGIGVSAYVEITAPLGLFTEYGKVVIDDDGGATMTVGTSAHGQAHDTAFSMIVSELLGIPMDKIRHVQSDTDLVPRGAGTMGSRSLQTAGSAVYKASEEVLEQARKLAAQLLEANEADIVKGDGGLQVAGVPARAVSWEDLAAAAKNDGVALMHELDFSEGDSTFPFGAHISVVEVDSETGGVEILRHVAVDDCGRILNPMLVRGQQHGGIAQGIAQVLYEHVQYDADANPQTGNLMDYLMPSAAEMPSFETANTQTDSPRNPLGAKGIGESGTIGSTPAMHNAVVDAVSHLGVTHIDMPCSPERVWGALQAAGVRA